MIKVPYVPGHLNPRTYSWAVRHGAQLVRLRGTDDAYHAELCDWWAERGDLVIVEQDILPAPGIVAELEQCEQEWCVSSYPILTTEGEIPWDWGLGCVKFSHALRSREPTGAIDAGEPGEYDVEPAKCWWMLDVRLGCRLARVGALPHAHRGSLHLRPRPVQEEAA
jgi:hypothetical protein